MTPTAYSLVLPPGWVRIPLRGGTHAALEDKVFRGIEVIPSGVPRDRGMDYRARVRRTVERMAEEARGAGGLDLYVPARARRAIPASFVVAEVAGGQRGTDDGEPEAAVARLAAARRAGEPGEVRMVADGLAARWEYVKPPEQHGANDEAPAPGSRRVDYVLPVPAGHGRWLAVSHSTPGDGDPASPYAQALTDVFDALMTTFRWTY